MNVFELMAYSSRLISDKGARVYSSKAEHLEHLQAAYNKVHGKFTAIDAGHSLVKKNYAWTTLDANTHEAEYHLPRNCESVKSVAILDSSSKIIMMAVPHDLVELQGRTVAPWLGYYFRRNTLILKSHALNTTSSATYVQVHYYRTPADLMVCKPTTVSGQNITLPAAPLDGLGKVHSYDAAYEGTEFEVVLGPGLGEVYEITSYAGSTRVATVRTGTTVSATTESILSVIPALPDRAHHLISYMAALDGARIEENRRAYQLLRDEVDMLWRNIEGTLTLRQVQAAHAIQTSYD